MARRFWPNESPLGKRIIRNDRIPLEVIGVVSDVSFPGNLAEPYTRLQAFRPLAQQAILNFAMSRCARPVRPKSSLNRCGARSRTSIRPSRLSRIRSASSLVRRPRQRLSAWHAARRFAGLGLALAAIGIYGVTSYSVVQRTSELGIRMALGAGTRHVLWLILSTGTGLIAAGATDR